MIAAMATAGWMIVDTVLGPVRVETDGGAITVVDLGGGRGTEPAVALPAAWAAAVRAACAGRPPAELPPLRPAGTPFQRQVWAALAAIPCGTTRTYGQIAAAIGRPAALRAVAAACGANPVAVLIPCHRVVAARGPGGYSGAGGLATKLALLRAEGAAGG
jgi:methylated-DNA-[protein]-cysteine S-methyltransferase